MKQKLLHIYYSILAFFAKKYLRKHKPYVIGINGSVGKTSCRMIVYQTLQKAFPDLKIYTSPKNFNGELGMSLSIFGIESWDPNIMQFFKTLLEVIKKTFFTKKPYDILILEYGIDRPGEMDFLVNIVKPHIGIFTAIDAVHSEQFGDPAAIANEEVKMIKNTLETAFLNQDDDYAMQLKEQIDIDSFTYQTQGHESKADIRFENEKFILSSSSGGIAGPNKDRLDSGTTAEFAGQVSSEGLVNVSFDLHIKNKKHHITTNLVGKAHYGYIGVALTIVDIIAHTLQQTSQLNTSKSKKLQLIYELQPGRMTVFSGVENSVLVDASYNASPLSMRKIINTVNNIKTQLFPERKVWMMLGDMRELGDFTEEEHRKLAGHVHQLADRIFLVGENMHNHMYDELQKIGYDTDLMHTFVKANELGEYVKNLLKKSNDEHIILAKGSQNTIFLEEAVKVLLEDQDDVAKLTRQSDWREKRKKEFFEG